METGDGNSGRKEGVRKQIPLEELVEFFKQKGRLADATNRESLYEKVFGSHDDVVWNLATFSRFKQEELEYEKYKISPFDVEEGVLVCHKCGCKKIVSFSRQVRSGDEPMSVFASCTKCRNQWVE